MVCKITSHYKKAYTLVEMLTATAVASLVFVAVGHMSFYGSRSFAKIVTTVETDQEVRIALERISDDVRRASGIAHFSPKQLIVNNHGTQVTYEYRPDYKSLTRKDGTNAVEIILSNCKNLVFHLYQRRPVGESFELIPAKFPAEGKVLQVEWSCSREIPSLKKSLETTKSARVVIREG